ncbi:uncharacterized protein LOC118756414 [Rhagoletis pomonella]|uniref:uncharacterized protein LOC118756414 n=1 Tax=Rhagoletis pomonella TaxID=28610 RepID=UPI00177E1AD7|nr:uncharacterized protein LOC118756414 [Rhagoletis pomonella]
MILHLPVTELDQAFWKIVADIQKIEFAEEIENLRKRQQVKTYIQKLTPFLQEMDINGVTVSVLRVGGRLSKAPIPFDAKFPALLPKDHRFTTLFIDYLHRKHLHAGPKVLIGRRGIPQRIYCDNATNFVGAQAKLKDLHQNFFNKAAIDDLTSYSTKTGFEFCFIPPRAPHFGGLWEAAVKSMKSILLKNLSSAHLTFEELQTVVIEVEAILNSRPLTPLSSDPNDGEALTPAHLLIGTSLLSMPDKYIDVNTASTLTQWQRVTHLKQRFWELWARDYILSLQQRSKWLKPEANIEIGQMVIIHEANLPPQHWSLGRIIDITPGSDGKVRVVDIKTTKGIVRRAVHKIAPLPTSD